MRVQTIHEVKISLGETVVDSNAKNICRLLLWKLLNMSYNLDFKRYMAIQESQTFLCELLLIFSQRLKYVRSGKAKTTNIL